MDAKQFQNALRQVLENYQRCGLTRVQALPLEQLAPDLLERLQAWGACTQQMVGAADVDQPRADQHAADQPAVSARPSTSAPQAVPESSPLSHGPHLVSAQWTLPVLDDVQRQQHLEQLDQQVRACRQCVNIVGYRQQTVFGSGPLHPRLCFVGEAPGADEDRTGQPFVGMAGQLLTKIIAAMKLSREDVYILNGLKCRPPQNRTPVPDEIANCRSFVEAQLDILQPQYIVCLGAVAVRSVLQSTLSIGALRGKFHAYRAAQVLVTYHPSYLLRNESAKRLVWADMQMLMREMGTGQ